MPRLKKKSYAMQKAAGRRYKRIRNGKTGTLLMDVESHSNPQPQFRLNVVKTEPAEVSLDDHGERLFSVMETKCLLSQTPELSWQGTVPHPNQFSNERSHPLVVERCESDIDVPTYMDARNVAWTIGQLNMDIASADHYSISEVKLENPSGSEDHRCTGGITSDLTTSQMNTTDHYPITEVKLGNPSGSEVQGWSEGFTRDIALVDILSIADVKLENPSRSADKWHGDGVTGNIVTSEFFMEAEVRLENPSGSADQGFSGGIRRSIASYDPVLKAELNSENPSRYADQEQCGGMTNDIAMHGSYPEDEMKEVNPSRSPDQWCSDRIALNIAMDHNYTEVSIKPENPSGTLKHEDMSDVYRQEGYTQGWELHPELFDTEEAFIRSLPSPPSLQLNDITCGLCNRQFEKEAELIRHIATFRNCNLYPVAPVEGLYSGTNEISDQIVSTHRLGNSMEHRHANGQSCYLCPECGHCFPVLARLRQHLTKAHNKLGECYNPPEKRHECRQCSKCFLDISHLQQHVSKGHVRTSKKKNCKFLTPCEGKRHICGKCPECGHCFPRPSRLRHHVMTVHNESAQDLNMLNLTCEKSNNPTRRNDSSRHGGQFFDSKIIVPCPETVLSRPQQHLLTVDKNSDDGQALSSETSNGLVILGTSDIPRSVCIPPANTIVNSPCDEKGHICGKCPECGHCFPLPSRLRHHLMIVHNKSAQDLNMPREKINNPTRRTDSHRPTGKSIISCPETVLSRLEQRLLTVDSNSAEDHAPFSETTVHCSKSTLSHVRQYLLTVDNEFAGDHYHFSETKNGRILGTSDTPKPVCIPFAKTVNSKSLSPCDEKGHICGKCPECGHCFPLPSRLRQHLMQVHNISADDVNLSHETGNSPTHGSSDIPSSRPVRIPSANVVGNSKSLILVDEKGHVFWKCPECDICFPLPSLLRRHLMTVHKKSDVTYSSSHETNNKSTCRTGNIPSAATVHSPPFPIRDCLLQKTHSMLSCERDTIREMKIMGEYCFPPDTSNNSTDGTMNFTRASTVYSSFSNKTLPF